jgi:hypothetical protein
VKPTEEDRLAEIERQMAAQAAELERLRGRDPQAAMMRALEAPRIVSPAALEREQRDRAAAAARQAQVDERHALHETQRLLDAPLQAARDQEIAELERRHREALDAVAEAERAAACAGAAVVELRTRPLSREATELPAVMEPAAPIRVGTGGWNDDPRTPAKRLRDRQAFFSRRGRQ